MNFDELSDLIATIEQRAADRSRVVIAVAGPPASGKSTLASALAAELPDAVVMPMDGFHLDNEVLTERGLLERKGAPETFDVEGFTRLAAEVAAGRSVWAPAFDRSMDCVIPDYQFIPAETRYVVVEGNYLMLDEPGWAGLEQYWDITVSVDVAEDELQRRLIARWLEYDLSPEQAKKRALGNDIPNAHRILENSKPSQITIKGTIQLTSVNVQKEVMERSYENLTFQRYA